MYQRNPFPQKIEIKERISSYQDDFTLNNEQRDKIKKFPWLAESRYNDN